MSRARIGLLTGPVGVGKTTVAEETIGLARRRGLACGGLLAPAVVDGNGQKVGIRGVDARTGAQRILARTDCEMEGPAVGPYSFDATSLDWAVSVIESAIGTCDLLVVDEIGKLELWQGIGLAPILGPLASGRASRSLVVVRDSLLTELQARLRPVEQVVLEVSEQNREGMPSHVIQRLSLVKVYSFGR